MRYKTLEPSLETTIRLGATAPLIYALIFPLLLLDLFISLYAYICFPIYGLKIPDRKKYIVLDRGRLEYLDWMERLNCEYCGYANGFILWAQAIAAETEGFWCGIRHHSNPELHVPDHHADFLPYDDAEAYHELIHGTCSEEESEPAYQEK